MDIKMKERLDAHGINYKLNITETGDVINSINTMNTIYIV